MRAHPDAEISKAQREELAARMASKRHELAQMLDTLSRQIAAKDDCSNADAAEAASLQKNRLRPSGIVDKQRRTIAGHEHSRYQLSSCHFSA